jgi:hypothetical protein
VAKETFDGVVFIINKVNFFLSIENRKIKFLSEKFSKGLGNLNHPSLVTVKNLNLEVQKYLILFYSPAVWES